MRVWPIILAALCTTSVTALPGTTYEAEASCAWDDAHLDIAIVPPAPGYALYNDGPTIIIGSSHVVEPETRLLWDSAHADAALRAVHTWERLARAHAPHLAALRLDAKLVEPRADPEHLAKADILVSFTPVQDAAGRAVVTCSSVHDRLDRYLAGESGLVITVGTYIVLGQFAYQSFTPNDTYNVMLHELGHALGLEHVEAPRGDIMRPVYPHRVGNIHNPQMCLSTLDLERLAANYLWLDGVSPFVRHPGPVSIPTSAYGMRC